MSHSKKANKPQLRAIIYDEEENILQQIDGERDENKLIAQSVIVLEEYHDAHCRIEESDSCDKVIALKRCSVD